MDGNSRELASYYGRIGSARGRALREFGAYKHRLQVLEGVFYAVSATRKVVIPKADVKKWALLLRLDGAYRAALINRD